MGNYEQLKQAVADVIKSNGNQEITGAILQNALLTIISTVGDGATFAGIATPTTNPGTPDQNFFYIASDNGIYSNFNGITLNGEVAILSNKNGSWNKTNTGIATQANVNSVSEKCGNLLVPKNVILPLDLYVKQNITFANANKIWTQIVGTGSKFVKIEKGHTYNLYAKDGSAIYTLLTTNVYEVGGAVPLAAGYESVGNITINQGNTESVTIPTDSNAEYLYLRDDTAEDLAKAPILTHLGKIYDLIDNEGFVNLNLLSRNDITFARAEKTWKKLSGTQSLFIPIEKGHTYNLYAKDGSAIYTLLTTNVYEVGGAVPLAAGYESVGNITINQGNTESVTIPTDSNAEYLYLRDDTAEDLAKAPIVTDESYNLANKGYVQEKIDEIKLATSRNDVVSLFDFKLNSNLVEKAMLYNNDKAVFTDSYMTLPIGYQNHIDYIDTVVFDDEAFILDVEKGTDNDVIILQSVGSSLDDATQREDYLLNHDTMSGGIGSQIKIDFQNGKITINKTDTYTISTIGEELESCNFDTTGDKFLISWGRKQRYVFASVYNYYTCEKYECIVIDEYVKNKIVSENYNAQFRPAGWMYYAPSFYQLAGETKFKRFRCIVPNNLDYIFQGDSYTQGHAGYYKNCWSHLSALKLGNCLTGGISGSKLLSVIEQYRKCIKGKINVKNIVVTIGINDMSTITPENITTWIAKYREYTEELVQDGITPIINLIWSQGATADLINENIETLGFDGVNFSDINLSHTSGEIYIVGHLTQKGNEISYKMFTNIMQIIRPI